MSSLQQEPTHQPNFLALDSVNKTESETAADTSNEKFISSRSIISLDNDDNNSNDADDTTSMSSSSSSYLLNSIGSSHNILTKSSAAMRYGIVGSCVPHLQEMPIGSTLTAEDDTTSKASVQDKYRMNLSTSSSQIREQSFSFYSTPSSSGSVTTGVAPPPPPTAAQTQAQAQVHRNTTGISLQDLFSLANEGAWALVECHVRSHPRTSCQTPHAGTGSLLLHHVCKNTPPASAVIAIINAHPKAASTPDFWGYLPVHYACTSGASVEVLTLVLRAHPLAAQQAVDRSRLPLHLACQWGASPEALIAVLEYFPAAVDKWDSQGDSPVDYIDKHVLTAADRVAAHAAMAKASQFQQVAQAARECMAVETETQLQAQLTKQRRGDRLRQQSLQRALAAQTQRVGDLEGNLAEARREAESWRAAFQEAQRNAATEIARLTKALEEAQLNRAFEDASINKSFVSLSNHEAEVVTRKDEIKPCPNNASMETATTVCNEDDDEEASHSSENRKQNEDVVVDISMVTDEAEAASQFRKNESETADSTTQPVDPDHSNNSSIYSEDFYSDDHAFDRDMDRSSPVLAVLEEDSEVASLDLVEVQRSIDA